MNIDEKKKKLEELLLVNDITQEEYENKIKKLELEEANLKKAQEKKKKKLKKIIIAIVVLIIIWIIIRMIIMMTMISQK